MAENLRKALQDITLGVDDAPELLSVEVCYVSVRVNQFSLMGHPLMQRKQNAHSIIASLYCMWGITSIIYGRIIEKRWFQFVFPSEDLMQSIRGIPLHAFNGYNVFLGEEINREEGSSKRLRIEEVTVDKFILSVYGAKQDASGLAKLQNDYDEDNLASSSIATNGGGGGL